MKYILLLVLVFLLIVSCSSSKTVLFKNKLNKDEIKVLEISILNAIKEEYNFRERTRYNVNFLSWKENSLSMCQKIKYLRLKDCLYEYNLVWKKKFKSIIKDKDKKLWIIRIETQCVDYYTGVRRWSSNYRTLFIDNKSKKILYSEKNILDLCENNI